MFYKSKGVLYAEKTQNECSNHGHWNKIPVNKIFIEQPSSESKVKVLSPTYEPLEVVKCEKCGEIVAEPKEVIHYIYP